MGVKAEKTILLVEDVAFIAMAEKMTLEKFGYKVIVASTGEDAVAFVEKTPAIDLVLMDINLGEGMDGTEAAAIIIRQRDLPVVFLSSHTESEVVARTEKITSYGYVVKESGNTVLQASIKMAFKLFDAKKKEQEKESQREAAFEALKKSEERFRQLAEVFPETIFEANLQGDITYANQHGLDRFGYSEADIASGVNILNLVSAADRTHAQERIQEKMRGINNGYAEYQALKKDGSTFHAMALAVPIISNGTPVGLRGFILDISGRRPAEEELKRQLAEKDMLLREVHHRIKNNLASIGALISLHLKSVIQPEAIAALQDASGRVDSMRILYDKLLLTENYKDVAVKNYVESLATHVVALSSGSAKVAIDLEISDFRIDARLLFFLGIMIHELLANSMKYAFVDRDNGSIKISLENIASHVTLVIQDNGHGLPAGFDANESKEFGLTLVQMLSKQLAGSFVIENNRGTRCTIEFDI